MRSSPFTVGLACATLALSGCASVTRSPETRDPVQSALAANPQFAPFRVYLRHVVGSIQHQWDGLLASATLYPPVGTQVTVRFVVTAAGTVDRIVDVDSRTTSFGAKIAVNAIANAAPFGTWTQDMKAKLGREQELMFTFCYQ